MSTRKAKQFASQNPESNSISHPSRFQLDNNSQVAVIGSEPADSFFTYFLLDMALRVSINIQVDIFEFSDFLLEGFMFDRGETGSDSSIFGLFSLVLTRKTETSFD